MKFVTQDYYEILSVSPGATNEEVKRAYRLVRQSFRPDSMAIHSLYAPEETEAISAKIDEAFRILSDPELARRYAKYHRSARPGAVVPRDPDVFFDLVHDLDGPSPIEQLARQVGRLSEVRRRADRVAEEPVSASLRSIPPEPRYNPSPVSSVQMPAVASPPPRQPTVVGDPVDTEPARALVPRPTQHQAPPMSLFDEPVVARASVLIDIDSHDEEEIQSISVLSPVSLEGDDDEAFISLDDDDLSEPIESLPSSAFLAPLPPVTSSLVAPAPVQMPPVTPARRPQTLRPAAKAPFDPSLMPLPGARVQPAQSSAPSITTVEPAPQAAAPPPQAVAQVEAPLGVASPVITRPFPGHPVQVSLPHAAPVVVAPAPVVAAAPVVVAPAPVVAAAPVAATPAPVADVSNVSDLPTAAPTPITPETKPTAGSLALARRAATSRRWDRTSIRTCAAGPLHVTPLSREVIESMEMDCGGLNGEFLKTARRELGVAIKDISERTKISVMMLRYMEADDIAELPAKVYLKGYLTQVARLLKLPVKEFVAGYFKANGIP
ncbi:MAG: helix-turn-helix domain-containing protein [Deltaproteobacteria bacterium]|nr:helix-turn-helix domain-containing protein [Deltaproteobacteria bacterium]